MQRGHHPAVLTASPVLGGAPCQAGDNTAGTRLGDNSLWENGDTYRYRWESATDAPDTAHAR